MSLIEMQKALCRVLTDHNTRLQYLDDPASVLTIFDLDSREKECLMGLDRRRLQRYADMLLLNRLDLAFKALPRIRACFWRRFIAEHATEYGKAFPPVPVIDRSPMLKEVQHVTEFLRNLIRSNKVGIPAVENVLRYETTMFFLATESDTNKLTREFEDNWNRSRGMPVLRESVPVLTPGARIESFEFDVLREADDPASLDLARLDKPTFVVFHRRANVRRVRVFRVNSSTAVLLRSCDGVANVQTICQQVFQDAGDGAVLRKTVQAISGLQASGLVALA